MCPLLRPPPRTNCTGPPTVRDILAIVFASPSLPNTVPTHPFTHALPVVSPPTPNSVDNSEWARAEVGGTSCWAAQQRAVEAYALAHAGQTLLLAATAPPAVVLACRPGNAPACAAAVQALRIARGASLVRALQATCLALHAVCVTPSTTGPADLLSSSQTAAATAAMGVGSGTTTCNGFRVRIVVLACGAHRELADTDAHDRLAAVLRRAAVLRARIDVALFAPGSDPAALAAGTVLRTLATASRDGRCITAPVAASSDGIADDSNNNSNSNKEEDENWSMETWLEGVLAGPPRPRTRGAGAREPQLWLPLARRVLQAEAAARARRRAATALGRRRAALCGAAFGPQQEAPVLAQPTSCAYGLATRILAADTADTALSVSASASAPTAATTTAAPTTAPSDVPIPRHACTVLCAVPAGEVHVTLARHAAPLPARGTLLFVRTRPDAFALLWRARATGEVDDTLAVRRRCGTVRVARVPGGLVVAAAAAAPCPARALFWAQTRDAARVHAFAAAAQRALGPPALPVPPLAPYLVPRCCDGPSLLDAFTANHRDADSDADAHSDSDTDSDRDAETYATAAVAPVPCVPAGPEARPPPSPLLPPQQPVRSLQASIAALEAAAARAAAAAAAAPTATATTATATIPMRPALPGPRLAVLSHQSDSPFLEPRAQAPRHDSSTATTTGGDSQIAAPAPPLPHGHKNNSNSGNSNSSGNGNSKKHERQGSRRAQRKQYVASYPHKFSTPADSPGTAPSSSSSSPPAHHTSPASSAAAPGASTGSVPVLFLSSSTATPASPSTGPRDAAAAPGGSPLLCLPAGVSPRGMAPLQTPPVSPSLAPLPSPAAPLAVSPLVSPGATPLVTPSSSPRPYDTFYAPCPAPPPPRGACAIGPIPATAFAEHLPSISSVFFTLCPRSPPTASATAPTSTGSSTDTDTGSNSNHTHARRRPPAPSTAPPPQQPVCKHSRRSADNNPTTTATTTTGDGGNSSDSGADDGGPPPTPTPATAEPP